MKALALALLALCCGGPVMACAPVVVYRTAYVQDDAVMAQPIVDAPYYGGALVSGGAYWYASAGSSPVIVRAPTHRTAVVVVQDRPPSQRKHTKWHYDRAVKRCDGKGTKWARERCYRGAAR